MFQRPRLNTATRWYCPGMSEPKVPYLALRTLLLQSTWHLHTTVPAATIMIFSLAQSYRLATRHIVPNS